MIELIKIVVLGVVEGITEFLPISSTGHLIVATALLQPAFSAGVAGTFELFIQFGAVVAVVIYFLRDLLSQARALPTDARVRSFWLNIVIAVIPAGVIGFLLRHAIKEYLFTPVVVAVMLIIGGILFIVAERMNIEARGTTDDLMKVSPRQAIWIGVAQVVALIPGVSRSAASIFGGMGVGLTRQTATRFSFYLAIPTLGGATLVDLILSLDEVHSGDWVYLILGAVVAGIVAYFAIGWLLRFVATNRFTGFGWYRIAAGAVILLLVALHAL